MGEERFQRYLQSFDDEPPVSIRLNPLKVPASRYTVPGGEPVPWCPGAFWLPRRPNFTMDPLLHAGCYYVQEAASMFLDEVLRQHLPSHPVHALDLCAAPGGKSTLMAAAMPPGSTIYSNEPIPRRAAILLENVTKWGHPRHVVTSNYPPDYSASKFCFDVILCDVPCSGEGMFRKDPATISQWSTQNVQRCAQLQRDIVSHAWKCLQHGGLLIYSTCTFNTKENEENVRWMTSQLGAQMLHVSIPAEWSITGSLLPGFHEPVYRFIPGITRSEGLFIAVMRKDAEARHHKAPAPIPPLRCLSMPTAPRTAPLVPLSYQQAIAYLRGEALTLPPDTPCGIVTVAFHGQPLGTANNIGSRANNLYPKQWRIKTTHVPQDYSEIIASL